MEVAGPDTDRMMSEPLKLPDQQQERKGSMSLGAPATGDGVSPINGDSTATGTAPIDPNADKVAFVANSEIGISTCLNRLKQSIASGKEFASMLNKRARVEEEHCTGLKRLCRTASDSIRKPEHRHGSFLQALEEMLMIHERMADNGQQFAISLQQMHNDLMEVALSCEMTRKHWKANGLAAELRVGEAETAMRKSKNKYDAYAEDYDRARTGDRQQGKKFGLKGPKSAAQHEEDLLKKVQAADADYAAKVQNAQSLRAELLSNLRPEATRGLQDAIRECDAATTLQMQKFAAFNEKLLLSNGLNISPMPNGQGGPTRSLRQVVSSIDNEQDFSNFMISHQGKVPARQAEIKYERNAVLNPSHTSAAPPSQYPPDSYSSRQGPPQQQQSFGALPSQQSFGGPAKSQSPYGTNTQQQQYGTPPSQTLGSPTGLPTQQSQMSQPYDSAPPPMQPHQRTFSQGQGPSHQPQPSQQQNNPQSSASRGGPPQQQPQHDVYNPNSVSSAGSNTYNTLSTGSGGVGYNGGSMSSAGPPQLGSLPFQTTSTPQPRDQASLDTPTRHSDTARPYAPSSAVSGVAGANHLPPLKPVFGLNLEQLFERDGSAVPMIVYQCIQAVDLFGLEMEGIYRINGTQSQVTKLRALFDHDSSKVDFRNPESFYHDVNSVAGLLKRFFHELPDPLLTHENYDAFIDAARNDDDTVRRDSLHAIINGLPDPNYATLRAITLHLNRVAEQSHSNRMGIGNLSIVFGPTLMGDKSADLQSSAWQVRVVETILNNCYQIFDDD
ncbi:hypothetical protein BJ878DRAFT_556259 [Calycina marina]|uniref:Rho-GAP domain-containing protein n=1 Tax=Calycina marina TaxID=1763456 RepID=A0A9P7Z881_9HELO|nr:hypothetical protein BJ878DRAFT_556259 [Calycina marina]